MTLLRCMSPFLALFGHGAMSELNPLCDQQRTSLSQSQRKLTVRTEMLPHESLQR
jgi:hypothetical protein